jgi:CheY-like chemotaxis protein
LLIADDHLVVRVGLRTLLESEANLAVVGEASNGAEAVTAAQQLLPDVVVMDISIPEMDGLEARRRAVSAQCARTRTSSPFTCRSAISSRSSKQALPVTSLNPPLTLNWWMPFATSRRAALFSTLRDPRGAGGFASMAGNRLIGFVCEMGHSLDSTQNKQGMKNLAKTGTCLHEIVYFE